MISILHPSRSRPQRSFNAMMKWKKMAGEETQLIVSIDDNDPFKNEYFLRYAGWLGKHDVVISHDNQNAVQAINAGAREAKCDIMIIVSDDTEPISNWALELKQVIQDERDFILKTQDGIQPWIITMPVLDRIYYNRFGYIYHPDYSHCFCDTELSCVAELTGRLMVSNLLFPHNHYSVGGGEKDSVSEKADATFESGKKIFIERKKNNFDLVNPIGKLPDNVYTRM